MIFCQVGKTSTLHVTAGLLVHVDYVGRSGTNLVYKEHSPRYPTQIDKNSLKRREHLVILEMRGVALTRIHELEFLKQPVGNSADIDMVFGFLEDGEPIPGSFPGSASSGSDHSPEEEVEDDQEKGNHGRVEDDRKFWETQHQILQSTLRKSSPLESKIRNATKEALNEIQMSGNVCACGKPVASGACRSCLMREVSGWLRNAGYNSAVCKSKWRSSLHIPSGEHTFIDVIDNSSSQKGEVRVIIELNFRAEFEMARASEDYNRLVRRLPEVFVGKVERLTNVIKILCTAAKKCMKEKKMHMGPWRKQRYMQAKWLSSCERTASVPILPMGYNSGRLPKPKPRASMLTMDLLEKLPNMHCTAVEVS